MSPLSGSWLLRPFSPGAPGGLGRSPALSSLWGSGPHADLWAMQALGQGQCGDRKHVIPCALLLRAEPLSPSSESIDTYFMHNRSSLFPYFPGPQILEQHTGSGRGAESGRHRWSKWKGRWPGSEVGAGSDVRVLCEWLSVIKLSFVYKGSLLNTQYVRRLIHSFKHSLSTYYMQALCRV